MTNSIELAQLNFTVTLTIGDEAPPTCFSFEALTPSLDLAIAPEAILAECFAQAMLSLLQRLIEEYNHPTPIADRYPTTNHTKEN